MSVVLQDKPKILYQINDQEFLGMNTGSLEDVAEEVSKELAKEKVLFQLLAVAFSKQPNNPVKNVKEQ